MRILVAGDFAPRNRAASLIDRDDYGFLEDICPIVRDVDYSIVNLESPVLPSVAVPIEKIGPNLSCSEKAIKCLSDSGFNCVTLANNHFYDYGENGVIATINSVESFGISHCGGGKNIKEASRTLFVKIKDQWLAIINCCEHEFSIASEDRGGANPLNPISQYYAIQKAKERADYVIVIVHGGNEYYQLPSPRMQEVYRFFINVGADAVVNHHQHCFSGYEIYNGKPIFYGLGNFCFDKQLENHLCNDGYMVELNLQDTVSFIIHPYIQFSREPVIRLMPIDYLQSRINELNFTISSEETLSNHYRAFLDLERNNVERVMSPFSTRLFLKLVSLHLLPAFFSKRKKQMILGYLQCESHLPKVLHYLRKEHF